ncbi:hypothetical protein [Azohydromonas australica]|uniref:hypothetical protein n=1 Tax=Azohydromonas australica TaxID=364039 RepID=UPI0012EC686F|nr:hypothetical protein [Azohydromonas australica]
MIEFSMPVAVESKEQVMAWLAYGIKADAISHDPLIPWAQKALDLKHLLPWERYYTKIRDEAAQRRKLWLARPHCIVERKWIKAVLGFLQEQASKNPEGEFSVLFDGEMLSVRAGRVPLGVPAEGPSSWNERYSQPLSQLASIPVRIMSDPVEMGIWQGNLRLDHGGQRWVSRRRSADQSLEEQGTVHS